ncbi:N-formylglutamate amidohydrolase [Pseudopelagicola sp. nBUS_19]|uniref:N-formylglutamate amidohydrolase n=1 Tax=unclassified Pseudopelagicola TaxID=2649563 RepID=UPI003EBEADF2
MSASHTDISGSYVLSENPVSKSSFIVVCEHASNHIPASFAALGLSQEARVSHVAWDPGAMDVSTRLAKKLDANLIASAVSRLIYDCNRPPFAKDAMPERSEIFDVPGNKNLTQGDRDARTEIFYCPFKSALKFAIDRVASPILITVHTFTPIYNGIARSVEIGILHDSDARLADAMLQVAATHTDFNVQRNAPYGPEHGVTHTLKQHAIKDGHLNVMLEIRNDLVETPEQQDAMVNLLSAWINDACKNIEAKESVHCQP